MMRGEWRRGKGGRTWQTDKKGLECILGLYPESIRELLKEDRRDQIYVLMRFPLTAVMIWSGLIEIKKMLFSFDS